MISTIKISPWTYDEATDIYRAQAVEDSTFVEPIVIDLTVYPGGVFDSWAVHVVSSCGARCGDARGIRKAKEAAERAARRCVRSEISHQFLGEDKP